MLRFFSPYSGIGRLFEGGKGSVSQGAAANHRHDAEAHVEWEQLSGKNLRITREKSKTTPVILYVIGFFPIQSPFSPRFEDVPVIKNVLRASARSP